MTEGTRLKGFKDLLARSIQTDSELFSILYFDSFS
jgi:hypothetical protein